MDGNQVLSAIGFAFDPRTEIGLRQRATAYCEQAKAAPGAWRFFLQLLRGPAASDAVVFFSLGVLQETTRSGGSYGQLTAEERHELRVGTLDWMRDAVRRVPPLAKFHTNKLAVVVAQLVRCQILSEWPGAFDELQALLLGAQPTAPQSARLFLRVLRSVDEEIVRGSAHIEKAQREHNTAVKDAMRRGCVPRLVEVWCGLVEEFRGAAPEVRRLASKSLATMQLYITWIDLNLVANDRVLRVVYSCVSLAVAPPGSPHGFSADDQQSAAMLRESACACIAALVLKGMPEENKLALLERIRIADVLVDAISRGLGFGMLPECLAQLLDTVGQAYVVAVAEVLRVVTARDGGADPAALAAIAAAYASVGRLFQLALACMALPERDTVWCVLDFVSLFGHYATKVPALLAILKAPGAALVLHAPGAVPVMSNVQVLLRRIHLQMRYPSPPAYDFDNPVQDDDREREFGEFRADVRKIFTCVVRLAPVESLGFLCAMLGEGGPLPMAKLGVLPFGDVEAILEMVISFADRGNHTKAMLDNADFVGILVALQTSTVARHAHHAVLVAYMELSARYISSLARTRSHLECVLPPLLSAMCGFIGHPRKQLKGRACYLLLRMCRACGASLGPYAGTLLTGLQPLLHIPSLTVASFGCKPAIQAMLAACAASPESELAAEREHDAASQIEEALTVHEGLMHHGLAFDDQLQLYELVGTIVWAPWMDAVPEQQRSCTAAIVNPIFSQMETHVARCDAEPLLPGMCIARCLSALCSFSKGLGTREASSEVALALFGTVLERTHAALAAMPTDAQVRRRAMTLLHRMTVSLGERLLAHPSLPAMMGFLVLTQARGPSSVVSLDTISTTQLLNQLISSFCAKLAPLVDEMFVPAMQMVLRVQTTVADAVDAKLLRKLYFQLLHNLLSSELSTVLLSSRNLQHLPSVLDSIVHGCLEVPTQSRTVSKLCFTLLRAVAQAWFPPASGGAKTATAAAAVLATQQETRDAVGRFLWEKGTDAAFRSPLREGLDITDAAGSALLREVAHFVRALHVSFGTRCVCAVCSVLSHFLSFLCVCAHPRLPPPFFLLSYFLLIFPPPHQKVRGVSRWSLLAFNAVLSGDGCGVPPAFGAGR